MESKLSISNVLSGTFNTIGANPVATLGVAFLIGVLPTQIFSFALLGGVTANYRQLFSVSGGIALAALLIAFSLFCSMLVQAMLVRVTVAYARQEKVSIGTSLTASLSKVLPLLGLTILLTLALVVGTILLIVPGIILYIMWCVTTPALVAEDIGVFEAFSRSQELTKGNRWRIFGIFLLLLVLAWIFLTIVGVVLAATGLAASAVAGMAGGSLPIAYMAFNAVTSTLMTAFSCALIATLYVELRRNKEGPLTDTLADVFA
jgi:uncharacterized membrane protein